MKWTFALIAILFIACSSKQPYELAIEEYIDANLKDPDSYECISIGKPGIVTPMSRALEETSRRSKAGEFPSDSIPVIINRIKSHFESQGTNPYDTIGWIVEHRYRAKNSFGASDIFQVTYLFNKKLTIIEKAYE